MPRIHRHFLGSFSCRNDTGQIYANEMLREGETSDERAGAGARMRPGGRLS